MGTVRAALYAELSKARKRLKQARGRFESFDETDLIIELRESGEYDTLFEQIFNDQQPAQPAQPAVVEDATECQDAAQPIRSVEPSSHYCAHPQLHCQRQPTTAGVPMAGCSAVPGIKGIQWILTSP